MDELHPADAKRFCDTVEHTLRVVDGNIRTLQSDVARLTDGQHSHADTLQHRSALESSLYVSTSWCFSCFSGCLLVHFSLVEVTILMTLHSVQGGYISILLTFINILWHHNYSVIRQSLVSSNGHKLLTL